MTSSSARERVRRTVAVVAAAAGVAAGLLGAAAGPSDAAESASVRAFAGVTLTTGAGISVPGPSVTLADVRPLAPGRYLVTMDTVARHVSVDAVDLVAVTVGCADKSGAKSSIGQYANTLKGTGVDRIRLAPRLMFTVTQQGVCWATARAQRINPAGTSADATRQVVLEPGTFTIVRQVASGATTSARYRTLADGTKKWLGTSSLALKGKRFAAARTNATLPSGATTLGVTGDLQLTTCTGRYGSFDETTNRRNLCDRSGVWFSTAAGPSVRTELKVRQYAPDGVTVCRTVAVPGTASQSRISAARHHAPRQLQGTVALPAKAGCGRKVLAYVEVLVADGPAVVVHWPGSSVTVRPI